MHHMDFITCIVIGDVLCTGDKVSIFLMSQLSKIYRFLMSVWLKNMIKVISMNQFS